ncbi:hypothetical protein [Roseateles saccharophilus]|uniref:Uncharacterized protein n=1 Tax=Roseateles saccharophilus TaxID=304 RepID=A0A4R3UF45_ROSSA|nr:hypothetical protein [Roseateles saccharophilus]MDG0834934.1 hypothetical protein [Roseateles saccharophilus]TCU88348.1 hypothetical protein EV671_104019 [Roseateles saccharophilus]
MVVKQVKHWFVTRANAARWRPIMDWAASRDAEFTQSRDGLGFLIEQPKAQPGALRIEWGVSQRSYLPGTELRMRCEMGLHPDLQLMVLCRTLMEDLERAVFEAYTDTLKTRVDTDTPEEMRWLVMFPKFNNASSQIIRQRYGLVGVTKELTRDWVEGELGEALTQASQDLLPEGHPFVLMCMRGNLYLRTEMADADLPRLQAFVRLLDAAARAALRVNGRLSEAGAWPTTTSVAWTHSTRPGDA